jgi:hypothetical protein
MFRSPKLLSLARGQACVMCDTEDDTVVAAHSNLLEHGKGRGMKAHDGMHAWLCYRCHSELDQGKNQTKEERRELMLTGISRTYMRLWDKGLIKTKG